MSANVADTGSRVDKNDSAKLDEKMTIDAFDLYARRLSWRQQYEPVERRQTLRLVCQKDWVQSYAVLVTLGWSIRARDFLELYEAEPCIRVFVTNCFMSKANRFLETLRSLPVDTLVQPLQWIQDGFLFETPLTMPSDSILVPGTSLGQFTPWNSFNDKNFRKTIECCGRNPVNLVPLRQVLFDVLTWKDELDCGIPIV